MLTFGNPPSPFAGCFAVTAYLPTLACFIVDEAGRKQLPVWAQDRGGGCSEKIRLAQNFSSQPGECNFGQLLHRDPFPAGARRVSVAPYAHPVVGYRDRVLQGEQGTG